MPKSAYIELAEEIRIPILHEDRSVLALDKPAGWLVAPSTWDRAARNLQRAIDSSINGGEFWARSRNLKFLKFIHRLDAETTGILLFSKSPGAMASLSTLFQSRAVHKEYLAVVDGRPARESWTCELPIAEDPSGRGLMRIDKREGKESVTRFTCLETAAGRSLLRAEPLTGRTHQIRLHLAADRLAILGDRLYGKPFRGGGLFPMGLRATVLRYKDPFTRREVLIRAPEGLFIREFGFAPPVAPPAAAPPSQTVPAGQENS